MSKFHVNPNSGEVGECKAKLQCPFGGEENHFPSKEEARSSFEERMTNLTLVPLSRRSESRDPEVEAARRWMLDTGDVESLLYYEGSAKRVAEQSGMREEAVQAAIDEFDREEQEEIDSRIAKQNAYAREIASKTDPDITKIKKGATVAFKFGDSLVTVTVSSHRNGRNGLSGTISGTTNEGTYADRWDDIKVLTSESKLDD